MVLWGDYLISKGICGRTSWAWRVGISFSFVLHFKVFSQIHQQAIEVSTVRYLHDDTFICDWWGACFSLPHDLRFWNFYVIIWLLVAWGNLNCSTLHWTDFSRYFISCFGSWRDSKFVAGHECCVVEPQAVISYDRSMIRRYSGIVWRMQRKIFIRSDFAVIGPTTRC